MHSSPTISSKPFFVISTVVRSPKVTVAWVLSRSALYDSP